MAWETREGACYKHDGPLKDGHCPQCDHDTW